MTVRSCLNTPVGFRTLVVILLLVVVAGCGGDDDSDAGSGPLIGEIAPAVDALEDRLGGTQEYFEIFADPLKVTLWVATDDATEATPYVYAADELSDAQESQAAEGETFTAAEGLTFGDDVLDRVLADMGDNLTGFSIVAPSDGAVRLSAIVTSDRGGTLEVVLAPDGAILESGPVD